MKPYRNKIVIDIPERIKKLREAAGITPSSLADIIVN